MQEFLLHVRKLGGTQQEDQEQSIRLTPLVPHLPGNIHSDSLNGVESSSYQPILDGKDTKILLLEKVRELQALQSRVTLVLDQVTDLLNHSLSFQVENSIPSSSQENTVPLDKGKAKKV